MTKHLFNFYLFENNFQFSLPEIICFALLFVAFCYQIYYYFRYINGVNRYNGKIKKNKIAFAEKQEPVSVIVCAKNEGENLLRFLPILLNQEYPDYEVIVIDDASDDNTPFILNNFQKQYSHLRTTFVPHDVTNLSTKKLGLTLGIKAAKNELLLFTDADCRPSSAHWLAKMARNFTPKTEFVLGYGAYNEQNTALNSFITYDTLFIALQYMGMALDGKPYMGVGRNLAYRKSAFFAQQGFISSLGLRSGDDDLLVNHSGNRENTRVEISSESVTWSDSKHSFKSWFFQKTRHLSVSHAYTPKSRLQLLLEPLSREIFYLFFILSAVCGNLLTLSIGVLLFLVRYFLQFYTINKGSKLFGSKRKYKLSLIAADIALPLVSLFIFAVKQPRRNANRIYWK